MLYAPSGAKNVIVVDGTTKVTAYAPDGSWNVTQAGVGTRPYGLYHPCGALNVTLVTSTAGRYAPDGSLRVAVTNVPGIEFVSVVSGSLS